MWVDEGSYFGAGGWGTALKRKDAGSILDVSLTLSFQSGVDLASKRHEYQEYILGVKAAGA